MHTVERISKFVGSTFSLWVILFAILGFFMPEAFVGGKGYISFLLGSIMFGMGLTLSSEDFREVFRRPVDVLIGVVGHYLIMPSLAFILAVTLQLPPDIAVGVILVGCCPSGTASNVMTYLSKGDVALGVSIAAVSTLIAPIATPALISLLAGKWMAIDAKSLFLDIVLVVIVPIVLGVIVKAFFGKQAEASAKALPLVSTIAIVLIVAIVVALNKGKIVETGMMIFAVVILHNVLGYLLGYFFAKLFGLNLAKRKAVTLETGMQNSGLGAALAAAHFNPLAAVPSAIFSVWHNLSGSVLATYFAKKEE
ncbi:sodium transporter [Brevibacillus agri]|uniref:Bile acid:sodium symporter family protein n=2 Tax=Brevibacillus TaxID=55080 RepID=A0A3M8AC41_9BACL|nr:MULTISPECIES: bile acid:sodium symporter family protein [Brevibacillus]MCG5252125.1 bile acid:sodium symporter family protein [Brevibacillus agri]MDN4091217.1 bile acid:sodium symporter family protein [Brevibacillus agri]MED1646386.1 bile acid:sodium symporter family protein [Brevibacillus agri]MED1657019.1 bile acid:sodium symporter family protein [Brevibacillus agri]MED1688734.1 bile acid:sodium symporter family protein [Brevibacillus agri]